MRQTVTHMVDDLDQMSEAVETFQFSYGGKQYELDLNTENADQFRAAMQPWVNAARMVRDGVASRKSSPSPARTRASSTVPRRRNQGSQTSEQNRQIREWAQSIGVPVSARGRIAQSVIDQYDTAHSPQSTKPSGSSGSGSSGSGSARANGRKTSANKSNKSTANKSAAKKPASQKLAGKTAAAKQPSATTTASGRSTKKRASAKQSG